MMQPLRYAAALVPVFLLSAPSVSVGQVASLQGEVAALKSCVTALETP